LRGRVLRLIASRFVFFAILAAAACDDAPTTPSPTADPPAAVAVTETFEETVPVGGSIFYSFSVPLNGTVHIRLANVGGSGVPSTVWLGVGIGSPSGTECSTTNVVNTAAGETPQITGTYAPGVYCAKVSDIGNLLSPANFTVVIGHP
jgi:hypothetical protein